MMVIKYSSGLVTWTCVALFLISLRACEKWSFVFMSNADRASTASVFSSKVLFVRTWTRTCWNGWSVILKLARSSMCSFLNFSYVVFTYRVVPGNLMTLLARSRVTECFSNSKF